MIVKSGCQSSAADHIKQKRVPHRKLFIGYSQLILGCSQRPSVQAALKLKQHIHSQSLLELHAYDTKASCRWTQPASTSQPSISLSDHVVCPTTLYRQSAGRSLCRMSCAGTIIAVSTRQAICCCPDKEPALWHRPCGMLKPILAPTGG